MLQSSWIRHKDHPTIWEQECSNVVLNPKDWTSWIAISAIILYLQAASVYLATGKRKEKEEILCLNKCWKSNHLSPRHLCRVHRSRGRRGRDGTGATLSSSSIGLEYITRTIPGISNNIIGNMWQNHHHQSHNLLRKRIKQNGKVRALCLIKIK